MGLSSSDIQTLLLSSGADENAKDVVSHWLFFNHLFSTKLLLIVLSVSLLLQYQRVPSYYKENPADILALTNESAASTSAPGNSSEQTRTEGGEDKTEEQVITTQEEEKATENGTEQKVEQTSEQTPEQNDSAENPVTTTS
jgi:hypothetical protein